MEHLASGIITLLNGLWFALGAFASPLAIAGVLAAASLAWLARMEVDELDRQGVKPLVDRH